MLCKRCGALIPDDVAKCEFCGEIFRDEPEADNTPEISEDMGDTKVLDLGGANPTVEVTEAANTAAAAEEAARSTHEIFEENAKKRKQQVEKVVDEKQQQLEEISMRRNLKKQKQKRNRVILIIVICALVAAAAGFGTYFIRNGGIASTIIATPVPSSSPIPTLAPVETPVPSASAEATATPDADAENSDGEESTENEGSSSSNGTSSTGSSIRPSGNTSSSSGSTSSSSSNTSSSGGSTSSSSGGTSSTTTSNSGTSTITTNTNKYSGIVTDKINSRLVIGDQVVYDAPSNKYFMTFNMDGTMYYAHVSEGSTTEQVKGKYITVTADPTNGRYNGNTVYEITSMTYYTGDYIIPDSGTRVIDKSEIQDFSKDRLALARNEIYARHGRKFQMEVYQNYFNTKSWYKINPNYDYNDDNKNLNSTELQNVSTILSIENSK